MKIRNKKSRRKVFSVGSALILAVVLTSLLAIIGVLFVMVSRVDKIATSAISENRELDFSIDAVVARIAQELVLDVPGNPDNPGAEYYDYPDVNNAWLAGLEPYEFGNVGSGRFRWRPTDLSDIYGVGISGFDQDPEIIPDYQDPVDIRHSSGLDRHWADADGDGVLDSVWVEVPDITSGTGSPIYAAIRVIDNSAMLNVNTAYKFDPCEAVLVRDRGDGSSLMQINLAALSQRGVTNGTLAQAADALHAERCYGQLPALSLYRQNVVWRYGEPNGLYTPFDISDELKLRNRYVLNYNRITTRIERLWTRAYDGGLVVPRTDADALRSDPDYWFYRVDNSSPDPCIYDYRHISTTYNMDRIIAPDGERMVNVNSIGHSAVGLLYDVIREGLIDAGVPAPNAPAAQMAVNIVDYRDNNDVVCTYMVDAQTYYGFERPCIYISELAHNSMQNLLGDPNDPNTILFYRSYAIELYRPYEQDSDPAGWRLVIDNRAVFDANDVNQPIVWSGTRQYHVVRWEDSQALLPVGFGGPNSPTPPDGADWVDPNIELRWPVVALAGSYDVYLGADRDDVKDANTTVDPNNVYMGRWSDPNYAPAGPLDPNATYYWRIDPVDALDNVISTGSPWSFTTAESGSGYSMTAQDITAGWSAGDKVFDVGSVIQLKRLVRDTGDYIVVDSKVVPAGVVGLFAADSQPRSFQRDTTLHKCIRRLWDDSGSHVASYTLGFTNDFKDGTDPNIMIQAHPGNVDFVGIGDIGKVFAVDASLIGPSDTEVAVRIDLANPAFQQLLNYLTVFDPTSDGIDNNGDGYGVGLNLDPNELRIPGRININTAPWYVIAQLPWVRPQTAQAIVAYRDKLQLMRGLVDYSKEPTGRGTGMVDVRAALPPAVVREEPGFASVAELLNVTHDLAGQGGYNPLYDIRIYGRDKDPCDIDQPGFPDLTTNSPIEGDAAANDFEERDLIFARISNLVTVRSDVFTAYILVRIGVAGPQRRVIAILDRSDVYYDPAVTQMVGRVRIIALHPVPDPR